MFPIYSRVTINGERIELSTKRSIFLINWDTKRQRPKLKTNELKALNYYLEQIRNKFYIEHQKLVQKGNPFSAMDLKMAYLNIKAKTKGIIALNNLFKEISPTSATTNIAGPNGGVISPSIKAITRTTPKCTGSIPSDTAIGKKIGTSKNIIAKPSKKHPKITTRSPKTIKNNFGLVVKLTTNSPTV